MEKKRLVTLLQSSGHAVISGRIGTGKTLLAKQRNHDVYINCYSHKSEYKILEEILRQIRPTFSTAGLSPQRLWREIQGDHLIILDEIEGIIPEDIQHFTYTLSRQPEIARRIRYIAITRSYISLKAMIQDPAIWSTFGEKAVIELEPYTPEEIKTILEYRAKESLYPGTYNPGILEMIAHITSLSTGHMRAGIDILRNSALICEGHQHDAIQPEDVREANHEGWVSDLGGLEKPQALVLLSVAFANRKKISVTRKEIMDQYRMICEGYNVEAKEDTVLLHLQELVNQGLIHMNKENYSILDYPAGLMINELEPIFSG
jgi:Cdc6-like AAA superfamily ATPase